MWKKGRPISELAATAHVTKNAITGLASRNRTDFKNREYHHATREKCRTINSLKREQDKYTGVAAVLDKTGIPRNEGDPVAIARREEPVPAPTVFKPRELMPCQWPEECGSMALPGRSYCDDHCARAYENWQRRTG